MSLFKYLCFSLLILSTASCAVAPQPRVGTVTRKLYIIRTPEVMLALKDAVDILSEDPPRHQAALDRVRQLGDYTAFPEYETGQLLRTEAIALAGLERFEEGSAAMDRAAPLLGAEAASTCVTASTMKIAAGSISSPPECLNYLVSTYETTDYYVVENAYAIAGLKHRYKKYEQAKLYAGYSAEQLERRIAQAAKGYERRRENSANETSLLILLYKLGLRDQAERIEGLIAVKEDKSEELERAKNPKSDELS